MKRPYLSLFKAGGINLLVACALAARADFVPLVLTADSYNQDMVVEKGAIHAPTVPPITTATLDTGMSNSGDTFYEKGFDANYPGTGIPVAGATITSVAQPDHSYTFATNYAANDAMLVDSTVTNATLVLATPAAYSALSFLGVSGGGGTALRCVVHHADGTTESGTLAAPDWFTGANQHQVLTANGRVNVGNLAFDSEGSGNPSLYALDLSLTNISTKVTTISLSFITGGHAGIFALSGSTGSGFSPISFSGYNADMIVETNIYVATPTPLNATTASMGDGTNNSAETWYEQGYDPASPSTGLPAAGSTLISASDSHVTYRLAGSYTANNAALIDPGNSATLTPAVPANYSALSFLTASANGQSIIDYVVAFGDGSTQNGEFASPDWYNNSPYAFIPNGRVNVGTGTFTSVGSGNPRLYPVLVQLTNTLSPVTSIQLSLGSAGPSAHAAVLAVSGALGALAPGLVVQPVSMKTYEGSNGTFSVSVSGTAPFAFRWLRSQGGAYSALRDAGGVSGSTTTNLVINPVAMTDQGNYVCVITNVAGSVTSAVATLTVLSTLPDVAAIGDPVLIYGGHQAEPVDDAIDGTTWKYLNFGLAPSSPPFVGPVGFIVTPSLGPTCVTAVRIYTANDSPERDPADYTLEGSNDGGTNFTVISVSDLALPDGRNPEGLNIDPLSQYNQEVDFANRATYTTYRLSFTHVKSDALANSMQIAEAELLGVAATPTALLNITRAADGGLTITTTVAGELWSTGLLAGAGTLWRDEGPISASVEVIPSGAARYYRVVVP